MLPYGWTVEQVKAMIDKKDKERTEMVERCEPVAKIEVVSRSIERLREWLAEEEARNRG